MVSSAEHPHVLSLIPGRVRLHLSGWTGDNGEWIENRLRRVNGVEDVQANPLTRNALIRFDRRTTDEKTLLVELQEAWSGLLTAQLPVAVPGFEAPARNDRSQTVEGRGPSTSRFIGVGVRGLLGHAVVDSLWFAAGFLGEAIGLPLAGLGPLHVLLDIAVWVTALRSGTGSSRSPATETQPVIGPPFELAD
jgi:hypothetical protein